MIKVMAMVEALMVAVLKQLFEAFRTRRVDVALSVPFTMIGVGTEYA